VLIVANDKGIGTLNSFETDYCVSSHNTHQDKRHVSIVPVPDRGTLERLTQQVYENNHWDLKQNIRPRPVAKGMPNRRRSRPASAIRRRSSTCS